MGQVIEGSNGVPVEATEHGLKVDSTAVSQHHKAAHDGYAYFFPIDGIGTNGAEHLAVIKNTSSLSLHVSAIRLFVATFKDTTRIKVYLNETLTYAANGTAVVPVNLKSGLVGGAVGEFYTITAAGTDITTFAGTAVIGGIYVFERYPILITDPGGWVVPPNQVFSLYNVGNDNTFYGGIDFYYHG